MKNDLISRNPLRAMGHETDDILSTGEFGAVMARAGVGKTAFLVQIALNAQLRERNVLHISLVDPVKKVDLWYREVFQLLANRYKVQQIDRLWDEILPHRFIMTFRVEGFTVPTLEERLADLSEQSIFSPQMIIIDGLPFSESIRNPLLDLKAFSEKSGIHVWFTVTTHRHEDPAPDGMPIPLSPVSDLFDVAIELKPDGKEIFVKSIKGPGAGEEQATLLLDPSTMLIKNQQ